MSLMPFKGKCPHCHQEAAPMPTAKELTELSALRAQVAELKRTEELPAIPKEVRDAMERTDWTPAEALQFYADQKNFDIVSGRARIIDNGAVASNALKYLSLERLELKGDAEITALREKVAELTREKEESTGMARITAEHLQQTFYPEAKTWVPLDNLPGLLSQVSNMAAGLKEKIAELESQLAAAKRDVEIGRQVNRACAELPDGYDLHILLEKGAGIVELYSPDGERIDEEFHDSDSFGWSIAKAIDCAIDDACANEVKS